MKKLIAIIFLFSIFIGNAFSEVSIDSENNLIKNEAYISVGTISCVGLFGGVFNSIADSISEARDSSGSADDDEPFEAFSIGLGYNLFLLDFLGFGGFFNVERFGQLTLLSTQAKITAQYGWKRFKFYHSVSGGVLFISDVAISPIFDVTLLGLKLDFDSCNIFLEASLPSTAFLKIGYAYCF